MIFFSELQRPALSRCFPLSDDPICGKLSTCSITVKENPGKDTVNVKTRSRNLIDRPALAVLSSSAWIFVFQV